MLLKQVPYLIICFLSLFVWILFVMEFLDMVFPKYVLIYLLGKPIASSYSLELPCIIACFLKLSRISIYLSMAFNSYLLPYAYVLWMWSWIYLCNPPPRNISIHYLSWQVIIIFVVNILIIFTLALALNCLIWLPRIYFDLTLFCLPCIFWILYCSTWNLFCAFLSWD